MGMLKRASYYFKKIFASRTPVICMYRITKIDLVKELVFVADEPRGKSRDFYFPKLSDAVFIEEYTLKLMSSDGRYKIVSLLAD